MQRLFEFVGVRPTESRQAWVALASKEFFDGDPQLDWNHGLRFTFDKALGYPISLTRFHGPMQLSYRRSWHHIRANKVGVRILWFVRRGGCTFIRSGDECRVGPGHAAIINSNLPYYVKMSCAGDSVHESILAVVPSHLCLTHIPGAEGYNGNFSLKSSEGGMIHRLIDFIFEESDNFTRATAEPLAVCFLKAVARTMGDAGEAFPQRQGLAARRLADIHNYIAMNATDPELSHNKVAANCGIRPRYLCHLLRADKTSFSDLLWKHRVERAHDLLTSAAARDHLISEIAFMSGFKTAAHFSRVFKDFYGCPPHDYRVSHAIERPKQVVA